jgi:hypothetical protein
MASHLINVRLDHDRLRKARRLRSAGVVLSDLVREAIDARFDAIGRPLTARGVAAAIAGILERYPDPTALPASSYNVHVAADARAAVLGRLARRPR